MTRPYWTEPRQRVRQDWHRIPETRGFRRASDYMKTLPDLISRWVPGGVVTLGTDGYGMSDTRRALRRHFEMDSAAVVVAALSSLCREGAIKATVVKSAMKELGVDPDQPDPRLR